MTEQTEDFLDDRNDKKKSAAIAKFTWTSDDPAGQCGCGPCLSPRWLQWFRWPPIILAYFWIVGVVIYMSSSYFGAVLPALEHRFGLSSTQSAFLSVANDLAGTLVCIFTSFFAERSSRPVVMGLSLMLLAFGKLLIAFPHFLSEPLDPEALLSGQLSTRSQELSNSTDQPQHMCIPGVNENPEENNTCNEEAVGFRGLLWWALIGQIVCGFGQASFTPIVIPYLDDLAGRVRSRFVLYYTVFTSIWTGGPALGYFLGGIALKYYVDFNRIPKDKIPVGISKWDPRWIGAWWMGFVASFVALFILSIPAFMLPKDPSVNVCVKKNRESLEEPLQELGEASVEYKQAERRERVVKQKGFRENAKAFLPVLKRILTRPVLVFQMFYMTIEMANIGVFAAFVVKYFMLQFGMSGSRAALLKGIFLIPASILGLCTSAFICRHFKLTLKQCALYLVINNIVTVALIFITMFVGCKNPSVAGINVKYPQNDINEVCNSMCGCKDNVFRPVCDPNGVSYISPCHAGCQTKDVYMNSSQFSSSYSDCSCLYQSHNSSIVQYKGVEFDSVKSGLCKMDTGCETKLYIVLLLFAAISFCRSLDNAPMSLIVLGNSETEIRSTVYGVTKVVHHMLGFFPTPIYFGAIINSTCWLWRYSCGNRGSCWLYDIVKLRFRFFGVNLALRVLQFPICIGILWTVKETLSKAKSYQNINNDDIVVDDKTGEEKPEACT